MIFDHTCIKVGRLSEEIGFYSKAFNMHIATIRKHKNGALSVFLATNESDVMLQLLSIPDYEPDCADFGHIAFKTDDIQAVYDRLSALGCVDGAIIDSGYQLGFFASDPEGYEIEIVQLHKDAKV